MENKFSNEQIKILKIVTALEGIKEINKRKSMMDEFSKNFLKGVDMGIDVCNKFLLIQYNLISKEEAFEDGTKIFS